MDHTKPTQEELQKGIEEATKKLDSLQNAEEETPNETTEEVTDDDIHEEEERDATEEEVAEEETVEEKKEDPQDPDYKKKWTESTREAHILAARNKKFSEAVDEANNLTDPTEEELKLEAYKQNFQYDDLSEVEKSLFKSNYLLNRKIAKISEVAQEGKNIEEWNNKVDEFTDDPQTLIKNPELEGKIDDFKVFASKPTRRGIDFETLIESFLYNASKSQIKHKGKMFETGSGGEKKKQSVNDGKLTVDQGRKLMQTNYKQYVQYLKEGKIASE